MLRTIFNNDSFFNIRKNKNIKNNIKFENSFTPIKLIHNKHNKVNKNSISNNINSDNGSINLDKIKIQKKENNDSKFNDDKNNNFNLKLQLLNKYNKNSRNFSPLNFFDTSEIFKKGNNYKTYNTNNSLSLITNLKTTIDSNITNTNITNTNIQKNPNLKDKINNKEINSSSIDSKTITFFSSSPTGTKTINPNFQMKKINNYINKDNNINKIIKRQKIKIPKSKSNIFTKIKNNKIIYKNYPINININKKNDISNINNNINSNTFIFPNRINILINLHQNFLTPIRQKNKIKYRNSLSLNKKINKIEENIHNINLKQKSIEKNKILIKRSKLKNIYILIEKQKESINYKDKIKKEKNDIEKILTKINTLQEKTEIIKNETKNLKSGIVETKNEINNLEENIERFINDKKKVNTMLVLLHRRIIDIKKRIEESEEHNYYLDKSFYELGLKYQEEINSLKK